MKVETIALNGLSVTIGEANAKIGFKRTRLAMEAKAQAEAGIKAGRPLDRDEYALLTIAYPAMVACVIAHDGFENWPAGGELSPADFLTLPDRFFVMWEQAVYNLNRHWFPPATDEATLKKTPPSQ